METITAYRVGERFSLDRETLAAEPVRIVLAPNVRPARSAFGEMLLYRGAEPCGFHVTGALQLGWCRVEDGEVN